MKRVWAAAVAGIAMLAFLGWFMLTRDRTDEPQIEDAAPSARSAQVASAKPAALVELLLLPDGQAHAIPESVRIGIGIVSPDQAARAQAALDAGPRADAARYSDLAIPTRWIAAPARLQSDGRVKVGPLSLPPADRYTLQARADDGLRFYHAEFTAEAVPATVSPIVGAGIRMQVAVAGTSILLRRTETSASPAVWQRLQQWIAPRVLQAFSEQALAVEDQQLVAPFAPGTIDVVLLVDGVEAERKRVTLPAGRIADLRFDPQLQAVARAVSVDLELEFVRKSDRKPVSGLQVDWLSGRVQARKTSDAEGRVLFVGVDRQREHQFSLQATMPKIGLPEWPERIPLQVAAQDFDAARAQGKRLRHRVELTPLRWLLARLPEQTAKIPQPRRAPYPIYVLQRQREGRWTDASAAHFITLRDDLAVSIEDSGTYRIAAALSPWRVIASSSTEVNTDTQQRVAFANPPGTDVVVTVVENGQALAHAPVQIIGPVGDLPPAQLTTDARGQLKLIGSTVPSIRMEIPERDQIEVRLSGTQAVADFGVRRER